MPSKGQLQLGSDVLQALEVRQLDLSTAFLVIQEMIAHWPKIVSYIGATGQLQGFQHVCVFGVFCVFGCRYVER